MKSIIAILLSVVIFMTISNTWGNEDSSASAADPVEMELENMVLEGIESIPESAVADAPAEPPADSSGGKGKGGKKGGKGKKGWGKGMWKKGMKIACKKFEERKAKLEEKIKEGKGKKGENRFDKMKKKCEKVNKGSDTDEEDATFMEEMVKGQGDKKDKNKNRREKLSEKFKKWKKEKEN